MARFSVGFFRCQYFELSAKTIHYTTYPLMFNIHAINYLAHVSCVYHPPPALWSYYYYALPVWKLFAAHRKKRNPESSHNYIIISRASINQFLGGATKTSIASIYLLFIFKPGGRTNKDTLSTTDNNFSFSLSLRVGGPWWWPPILGRKSYRNTMHDDIWLICSEYIAYTGASSMYVANHTFSLQ